MTTLVIQKKSRVIVKTFTIASKKNVISVSTRKLFNKTLGDEFRDLTKREIERVIPKPCD